MEQEQIELYSPFNAKNLSPDQVEAMQHLKRDDIKKLAEAYPNTSGVGSAYLVLKDKTKPDTKQTFPLSTWKNLWELIKVGQTQFVAFSFASIFNAKKALLKVAPVQDLTQSEAKKEIKTAPLQTVKPSEQEVIPTAGEQTAKTAEQIAQEEAEQMNGGEGSENSGSEAKDKKPIHKMNLAELKAEYEEVFGEEAEEGKTKAELIKAIQSK